MVITVRPPAWFPPAVAAAEWVALGKMADKEEATEKNEKTIAEDIVVTKYKMGGEMVNRVLQEVIKKCQAGASVREICDHGDKLLLEETGKVFKKEKEMKKGIAFPTCLSVNNCICHFSPLYSEPDHILQDGDMVKIDLGAHIDGYIAVVAHTLVIGASHDDKVKGKKADVIMAAHLASEAALRLLKPGNENYAVTDMVQKIAEAYECHPVEGMLSHQLEHLRIDGEKSIIQNPSEGQRKDHEKCTFEVHEVYAMDVLVSTGEGIGREYDSRVTVYKKTEDTYMLKMKASRNFFSDVEKRFATMPFNLRTFEDEKKAKMGVVECVKHKLIEPFHVLYEKPGEYVAQFKFTVLLMPTGSHKITGIPFEADMYESDKTIKDEEILKVLKSSVGHKGGKKKKKKPGEKTGAGEGGVGKTSIVTRQISGNFQKNVSSTLGASFCTCMLRIDGTRIRLQVWDTAGQERFRAMAPMYYRNANAALLVFDLSKYATFTDVKKILIHVYEHNTLILTELSKNVEGPLVLCLLGNKSDLVSERQVTTKEAADYAASLDALFFETSAVNNEGIEEAFVSTAQSLLKQLKVQLPPEAVQLQTSHRMDVENLRKLCEFEPLDKIDKVIEAIWSVASSATVPTMDDLLFRPEVQGDFDDTLHHHCAESMKVLQRALHMIGDQDLDDRQKSALKRAIVRVIVLCAEHANKENVWSGHNLIEGASALLNEALSVTGAKSASDLLVGKSQLYERGIKKDCFVALRPKLLKDTWKKYPAAKMAYFWLLSQIKFPELSDLIDTVMPTALILLDDHIPANNILGIQAVQHVIDNVSPTELRWHGRAEVIYAALKHELFAREPCIVSCLHPPLISILTILEGDPKKPMESRPGPKHDEVMIQVLYNMGIETQLNLRREYIKILLLYVQALGIGVLKWMNRILEVIEDYAMNDDPPRQGCRIGALKSLESVVQETWPRVPENMERICEIPLKLMIDLTGDARPWTVDDEAAKVIFEPCLSILRLCRDVNSTISWADPVKMLKCVHELHMSWSRSARSSLPQHALALRRPSASFLSTAAQEKPEKASSVTLTTLSSIPTWVRTPLDRKLYLCRTPRDVLDLTHTRYCEVRQLYYAVVVLHSLVKSQEYCLKDFEDDARFKSLLMTLSESFSSAEFSFRAYQSLLEMGIPPASEVLSSLARRMAENLRRMNASLIIRILDFVVSYPKQQQTPEQRRLLEACVNNLQLRWVEFSNLKHVLAVLKHHSLFTPEFLTNVQDKTMELLDKESPQNLSKVVCTLANVNRRPAPLLRALAYHMTKQELKLTARQLSEVLAALYRLSFPDHPLLDRIATELRPQISNIQSVNVIRSILTSVGLLRWRHTGLIQNLCEWMRENTGRCSTSEWVALLQTLASVSYMPFEADSIFQDKLAELEQGQMSNAEWVNVVWSLIVLDKASPKQLNSILDPKFFLSSADLVHRIKLCHICQYIRLSGLVQIPEDMMNMLCEFFEAYILCSPRSAESELLSLRVRDAIGIFIPSPKFLKSKTTSTICLPLDAEFIMDRNGNPLPCENAQSSKLPSGASKRSHTPCENALNSKPLPPGASRVAVLMWDYKDFTVGNQVLTGHAMLTRKLLQMAGYVLLEVPHMDFQYKNMDAQVDYLKLKVNQISGNRARYPRNVDFPLAIFPSTVTVNGRFNLQDISTLENVNNERLGSFPLTRRKEGNPAKRPKLLNARGRMHLSPLSPTDAPTLEKPRNLGDNRQVQKSPLTRENADNLPLLALASDGEGEPSVPFCDYIARVIKIDLPNFDELKEDWSRLSAAEIRLKMKEKGVQPIRPWQEKSINLASTGDIFEAYIPPEGDGKISAILPSGAKQKMVLIEKKSKSYLALRKIRSFIEGFDASEFAFKAQDIYVEAHKCLMNLKENEDRLHDLVTEKCFPEMTRNVKLKTIRWNFLKSIEPPRVVHARATHLISKENMFAQVTLRFHTQQTLAVYDRFGRLEYGSEVVAKDVLEYVVFENHLSNEYGLWRIHGKVIPNWMPPKDPIPRTYRKPDVPKKPEVPVPQSPTQPKAQAMFSTSTQAKTWVFPDEQVIESLRWEANAHFARDNPYKVADPEKFYLMYDEERMLLRQYEYHLRDFCRKFEPPIPKTVVGTAFHFFKRFYLYNSAMDYHPKEILVTCVFLACKVDEFNVSMSQFVANIHGDKEKAVDVILNNELLLMQQLQYHLTIHLPFRPVEGFLIDLKVLNTRYPMLENPESLRAGVEDFLGKVFFTDAILIYAPSQIALAAILNAASRQNQNLDSYVTDCLFGDKASDKLNNIIEAVRSEPLFQLYKRKLQEMLEDEEEVRASKYARIAEAQRQDEEARLNS
ncbi:unnamed protein product [Darwinula stevensoni]|uniref:Cyclin-H n=1 Tax=Darwinula stevensoni TaxID=69355 RepID=A0A7R9FP86_9CRUS|nr:unnamed protein product [Darwinula stevensoni]CAG0897293.1 unnamed protein product [Darwinula stevensoni]